MRKECSSNVSSRFFWGKRCVTAQKKAARESIRTIAVAGTGLALYLRFVTHHLFLISRKKGEYFLK